MLLQTLRTLWVFCTKFCKAQFEVIYPRSPGLGNEADRSHVSQAGGVVQWLAHAWNDIVHPQLPTHQKVLPLWGCSDN